MAEHTDRHAAGTSNAWRRYSWASGVVFVVALLAEVVVSIGLPINQNDSATKIARELDLHQNALIAVACLSMVYAVAFLIYLWRMHGLFRDVDPAHPSRLATLVLVGGVLFVTLHAVSDVGITGMLGGKLAAYSAQNDDGIGYTLYLTTFALDSVGDVLGSLFAVAGGLLVLRTVAVPRWLGWVAIAAGVLMFLQGFGLGGVIAQFGLILDLIAFVLLLTFVATSSVMLMNRSR